jgi:phage-related minor tail protein
MNENVTTWSVGVTADLSGLRAELDKSAKFGKQFGTVLTGAFDNIVVRGRGMTDMLRNVGLGLSRLAFTTAFQPLQQVVGNGLGTLLGGGVGLGGFGGLGLGGFGGLGLGSGTPVPFARGGVIASPIAFPLSAGTGIAGERGPEAIMPLRRGTDGSLGIAATGGSPVNVTFNVSTPDLESFRRSETQLAAMLARTVGRGQRNL